MSRLGGSTTPWKCEWEHKFSQSSEWVDLVVVRHHGSVHRDDMSGRVCVSERRQCESTLGGSTTPWEWEQTLSQNTSDVRSLSVVTQVRRM